MRKLRTFIFKSAKAGEKRSRQFRKHGKNRSREYLRHWNVGELQGLKPGSFVRGFLSPLPFDRLPPSQMLRRAGGKPAD